MHTWFCFHTFKFCWICCVLERPDFRLYLLRSSRGSLPPDSGGRRYVARGLERGELPVWPRTFGEHADQLGTQTDSDRTSGRTGLQPGALNSIYKNISIFLKPFFISSWSNLFGILIPTNTSLLCFSRIYYWNEPGLYFKVPFMVYDASK